MNQLSPFETFRENLYQENLRGAWELESLRYGIMARLGLSEPDALELACKIVAGPKLKEPIGFPRPARKQSKNNQRLDDTMQR